MKKSLAFQPGQKGTVTYDLNIWRSCALTALLEDLVTAEEDGLQQAECKVVDKAIERGVTRASGLDDGSIFRRAIFQDYQRLLDTYRDWNYPQGREPSSITERRRQMKRLRTRRNKLARRIRKNGHILEKELDKAFIDAQYEALNDLVSTLPNLFGKLAKVLVRYGKSN